MGQARRRGWVQSRVKNQVLKCGGASVSSSVRWGEWLLRPILGPWGVLGQLSLAFSSHPGASLRPRREQVCHLDPSAREAKDTKSVCRDGAQHTGSLAQRGPGEAGTQGPTQTSQCLHPQLGNQEQSGSRQPAERKAVPAGKPVCLLTGRESPQIQDWLCLLGQPGRTFLRDKMVWGTGVRTGRTTSCATQQPQEPGLAFEFTLSEMGRWLGLIP